MPSHHTRSFIFRRPLPHPLPRFVAAAATAWLACLCAAGPLNPPAGAIAPTGKTTQELFDKVAKVEPRKAVNAVNTPATLFGTFTIDTPGSYYLEADVVQAGNSTCIAIGCSDVTLDLNGFSVVGTTAPCVGIRVYSSERGGITIINGRVRGCSGDGINLNTGGPVRLALRNLTLSGNGAGIVAGAGIEVTDCRAEGNSTAGIAVGHNARLSGCKAVGNGTFGIGAGDGAQVTDSQSTGNIGAGFSCGSAASIRGCDARGNGGAGFICATGSLVESCNADSNTGAGFQTTNAQLVRGCTATGNTGGGIVAFTGTLVESCSALGNQGFGISAINQCVVRNNACANNTSGAAGTGAGIIVSGGRCRIEGNSLTGNARGLSVIGGSNWIGGNTAGFNGAPNYGIAPGNHAATITVIPANGVAIAGDTFTPASVTADPHANFTF